MDKPESDPVGMTGLGRKRRRIARALIVDAVLLIALLAFLFVSSPPTMGGGLTAPAVWITVAGFVGMLFGLAWMIRIYRADPEAHASSFRSRKF